MGTRGIPSTILSAWQERVQVAPRDIVPTDLALQAALELQDQLIDLIERQGGVISGGKIGLSDRRSFAQLGVTEPLSGLLFDHMYLHSGQRLALSDFVQPRVEGELCLILSADLDELNLTEQEAARAIAAVAPAIEVVDSRWLDWGGSIAAVVAENVSASFYVCGEPVALTDPGVLASAEMQLSIDGKTVATGGAQAAYGSPVKALHWLAQTLARRGRPLKAGQHVMSGAFARMTPVQSGQLVSVEFPGIGKAELTFG